VATEKKSKPTLLFAAKRKRKKEKKGEKVNTLISVFLFYCLNGLQYAHGQTTDSTWRASTSTANVKYANYRKKDAYKKPTKVDHLVVAKDR
jgi:hypothetical protein